MKLLSSPAFLAVLAFLLSIGTLTTLVIFKKDELWPAKQADAQRFPSVEFDPDASSYSPAETHAMNQLYKELEAAREGILKKEDELRDRERILDSVVRVDVSLEGSVVAQAGGELVDGGVRFSIPLIRILVLDEPLDYSVTFRH